MESDRKRYEVAEDRGSQLKRWTRDGRTYVPPLPAGGDVSGLESASAASASSRGYGTENEVKMSTKRGRKRRKGADGKMKFEGRTIYE